MDRSTTVRVDVHDGMSFFGGNHPQLADVATLDWRNSKPTRAGLASRRPTAGLAPTLPAPTETRVPVDRTVASPYEALIDDETTADGVASPTTRVAATRVLIVDDHTAFCEALAMAVDLQDDLVCVGGAASLGEAMAIIDSKAPDVILMDVHLPDGDGIEATARIRQAAPDALILILTGHADAGLLARAAAVGASGFLPKESPIATVLKSIRAARRGAMLIDGTVLAGLLGRMATSGPKGGSETEELTLTQRERDVLELMAQGQNPHAIATALEISLHTCRGYQKSVMAKLDAHSQLEAVVIANRRHLVTMGV